MRDQSMPVFFWVVGTQSRRWKRPFGLAERSNVRSLMHKRLPVDTRLVSPLAEQETATAPILKDRCWLN